LPGWITRDAIERTRATFEPLYGHAFTDDQIIELLLNVGNLFRLLRDSSSFQAKPSAASARGDQKPDRARRKPAARKHHGDETCSTAAKKAFP
jgi:hypothetical protein